MKKLRLDLDGLGVHSFEPGGVSLARGTVAAAAVDAGGPACETRDPFYCKCTVVDPRLTVPIL